MFRWKMDIGSGYELVYPIYGKDVSIDRDMESGEWFYREVLNGTLTFTKDDWYKVKSSSLDTDFNLILEKQNDLGWSTYWSGIFYKTDCEFDDKQRILKFKPETNDRYKKLLAGKDNEIDIIKLGPKPESLTYIKRTINQVYIFGSTFVTNIIGKNSYDISISPPTHDELLNWGFVIGPQKYFIPGDLDVCQYYLDNDLANFEVSSDGNFRIEAWGMKFYFRIPNSNFNTNSDFGSIWSFDGRHYEFWAKDGDLHYFRGKTISDPFDTFNLEPNIGTLTHVTGAVNTSSKAFTFCANIDYVPLEVTYPTITIIRKLSDNSVYYIGEPNKLISGVADGPKFRSRDTLEVNAKYVRCFAPQIYSRVLSDKSGLPIKEGDFSSNSGYKYYNSVGYTILHISDANTINENIYGKFSESALFHSGKYFDDYISERQTIPISKKDWSECSFWVEPGVLEFVADQAIVLKDAYKLGDFIKKLVQEIDPTILHEHSPEYSNLLYGGSTEYFITPKSNIIAGNYDSADSKELIKWSDLRNNLKAIFNADYYINDENKLIIEHVSFFRNGLSLSGRRVGFDITNLKCLETNRSWSFGANKYKYEKEKIPQRLTFSFMDKTSVIFDGNPIIVNNKFVADGVIDDYNASIITTDVDFIQSSPQDVNKDGFCLLAASGGVVQISTINLGVNKVYEIQNGQLAFTNLHEKLWLDDMPASSIKINQISKTAKSVKRTKVQDIEFPLSSDIDINGLIKTDLGFGKIKSHKFNISTLSNKLMINHDIE